MDKVFLYRKDTCIRTKSLLENLIGITFMNTDFQIRKDPEFFKRKCV